MMPMKPSVELKKEPDTQPHPAMRLAEYLIEEMKLEGSSNDLDHTSNVSHGETNFLGDGVPGYESGELNGPDNDTEEEEESRSGSVAKNYESGSGPLPTRHGYVFLGTYLNE
jgi:hypothetical protein